MPEITPNAPVTNCPMHRAQDCTSEDTKEQLDRGAPFDLNGYQLVNTYEAKVPFCTRFLERIYNVGVSTGTADMEQLKELYPYGTDYTDVRAFVGADLWEAYYADLFWGMAVKGTVLLGAGFEFTRGAESNFGSQRNLYFAQGGLRHRLTFGDKLALMIDTLADAGFSDNHNNFGKGLPLTDYAAVNVGFELRAGFEIEITDSVSIAPYFAVGGDLGIGEYSYWNVFWNGGLMVLFGRSEVNKGAREYVVKTYTKETTKVEIKEVVKPVPERIVTTYVDRKIPFLLPPELIRIGFANDNPDLAFNMQWFTRKDNENGELSQCYANWLLDEYMMGIFNLVDALSTKGDDYYIEIHVNGYANDTGGDERRRKLSRLRSWAVVQYLTAPKTGKIYKSGLGYMDSSRYEQIGVIFGGKGNIGHQILEPKICGVRNGEGRPFGGFDKGALDEKVGGKVRVIDDTAELFKADPNYSVNEQIKVNFGVNIVSTTDPVFRAATLKYVVFKNGKPISSEELSKWLFDAKE